MWEWVGEGSLRTSIALWAGIWVVQLGAAGLLRRFAMGDPFGAICGGVGACGFGALPRAGDVGVARVPRPLPLPPPRGVELRLPRFALDSKLTIRLGKDWGFFVSLCGVVDAQGVKWFDSVD